jgi:hypothetical protein
MVRKDLLAEFWEFGVRVASECSLLECPLSVSFRVSNIQAPPARAPSRLPSRTCPPIHALEGLTLNRLNASTHPWAPEYGES